MRRVTPCCNDCLRRGLPDGAASTGFTVGAVVLSPVFEGRLPSARGAVAERDCRASCSRSCRIEWVVSLDSMSERPADKGGGIRMRRTLSFASAQQVKEYEEKERRRAPDSP